MTKRCDGCVNYQPTGTAFRAGPVPDHNAARGECRIGPPQPSEHLAAARWPLVWADDWCGCFIAAGGEDDGPDVIPFPGPGPAAAVEFARGLAEEYAAGGTPAAGHGVGYAKTDYRGAD